MASYFLIQFINTSAIHFNVNMLELAQELSFLFSPRLFLEEQVNTDNPVNTVRNLCLILKHSHEDGRLVGQLFPQCNEPHSYGRVN